MLAKAKLAETRPAQKIVIKAPRECPWNGLQCEGCRDGKRAEVSLHSDPPIKIIYDVAACYSKIQYKKLIQESGLVGIELQHTFKNAILDMHNEQLFHFLMDWDPRGGSIYIGAHKDPKNPQGNGTGKSYGLHALTHQLCRRGIKCYYGRTVDFLMELRAAYDDGAQASESKVLKRYTHVPVLLWDDLGKESFKTEWAPEKFYYVIDFRIRTSRPLVISSNFSLPEIEARFGIDNYGPAIASRLAGCSRVWSLGGPDRRIKGTKKILYKSPERRENGNAKDADIHYSSV